MFFTKPFPYPSSIFSLHILYHHTSSIACPQAADAHHDAVQQPGQAALDYQKLLQDAQADRMQKDFDDSSVVVDAVEVAQKDATPDDKPAAESEVESDKDSEDEETGTANNE